MAAGRSGSSFDPAKTPGAFGALPPDAPKERFVNDPAAIQASAEQVAMARRYEQELAPLTFKDSINPPKPVAMPAAQPAAPVLVDPSGQPISSAVEPPLPAPQPVPPTVTAAVRKRDRWASAVASRPAPTQDGADGVLAGGSQSGDVAAVSAPPSVDLSPPSAPAVDPARPPVLTESDLAVRGRAPDQPYRPAASDTDSPSRGQPVAVADPNRRITGGFGDVGDAQYFPLDGMEVRELINGLLSQLHERLKDDLRFTIATTYPRCKVKVEVTVEAFGMDHAVVVPAIAPPHTKTPIEIARDHADEIVFVIVAERNEKVSADGDGSSTNQTRRDLGLEVPFKRQVGGVTFDRA